MTKFYKVMSKGEFTALAEELFEGVPFKDHVHEESGMILSDFEGFQAWYTPYGEIYNRDRRIRITAHSLGSDSTKFLLKKGFVPA